ncbi:MAG: polysaccharide biosynthesis tyrosine autokinase [Gammaproteobacteria bacterium]|nr:polysaccharide biosynthesis tyrosine autokinase [Gammaproteobacteria bacterium]
MIRQDHSLVIRQPTNIGPVIPPADVVEPKQLLGNLMHGRNKVFTTIIILMTLTGIILSQVTPRYTANALIMINSQRSNIVDFDSVFSGLSLDNDALASEIEIIKSRGLAVQIVETLNLSQDPEFNTALRPKDNLSGFIQQKAYIPRSWKEYFGWKSDELLPGDDETAERTRVIDKFVQGLAVSRKGNSRVIELTYTSESPITAAKVANTLVDIYIGQQLQTKSTATQDATKWLTERVEPLRKKVLKSEAAIERYRQKSGLTESGGITLSSQQMAELNSQLILAQTDYMEAQTRLQHIGRLASQTGGIESAPEVLKSTLIQHLREQEAGLQRKVGELSTEFGKLHPTMIQLRGELEDLQAKIEVEVDKIVSSIRYEAEIAGVRKSSLEASLNELKQQDAGINAARVQLQALQREAEADRNVLEALLARLKETSTQENIEVYQPDARVISTAEVPLKPSYPKTLPILLLMLFASTLTGILILFVRESMDNGFRTSEEIEQKTRLPSLGDIQNIRTRWIGSGTDPGILIGPESKFTESVRTLYANILLASANVHPKTVLVTSAESGEGATTTAACLARTRALAGIKTVIIDLNLRAPSLHSVFGIQGSPGISELLSGDCSLEEVMHKDPASGATVIPAGVACSNPADILMGKELGKMMRDMAKKYDLVILDSAPIMIAPDTRLLLEAVDTTVFVVRRAKTKRKIVLKALARIMHSTEQFLGVVLNRSEKKGYA